jgi:hypothetical protein
MNNLSKNLLKYSGANPFSEVQAKAYGEEKLAHEFFPTSTFLSLFNEQHEVLIGSRGSGKTVMLRMLSYSCLKMVDHASMRIHAKTRKFIGFYVPLRLEWLASLPAGENDGSGTVEYFQFAVNCKAAIALLVEIKILIRDLYASAEERLEAEGRILKRLARMWLTQDSINFSTLEELSFEIECHYNEQKFWKDGSPGSVSFFSKNLFVPIVSALPYVSADLGLSSDGTHWLACVDEAESLMPAYIKCFNTFMRSDKRPLVLKLATMPFKYTTRDTFIPGVRVEPNGNDFNFRSIDHPWDSNDAFLLTDHLVNCRLKRTGLFPEKLTLETFIGKIGSDDPKDYFRSEVGPERSTDKAILEGILAALSETRRKNFENVKSDKESIDSDYFKKFSPVYYVRVMRKEDSKGNRTVGWFAGPSMIRRVADGNPRRFIQIMHVLFETARETELSTKEQHRVLTDFVDREYPGSQGLPDFGLLLNGILNVLGELLGERVHGTEMVGGGVGFAVQSALLHNSVVRAALELGVAYQFLFVDSGSLLRGLTESTEFSVAHLVAVKFWLPMRKGDGNVTLKSRHAKEQLAKQPGRPPMTIRESQTVLGSLQLQLFDNTI